MQSQDAGETARDQHENVEMTPFISEFSNVPQALEKLHKTLALHIQSQTDLRTTTQVQQLCVVLLAI